MEETKASILERGGVSNQQALVKRAIKKNIKPRVLQIPGGKTMMNELTDERLLTRAIYNWFRKVQFFDSVKIQFVDGVPERETETKLVENLDTDGKSRVWDRADYGGKRMLAERVARHILANNIASVSVKKDGIYIELPKGDTKVSPDDEDWNPIVEFVPSSKGEYSVFG